MVDFEIKGQKREQDDRQQSPLDGPGVPVDTALFEQPVDEAPFERSVLTTPLHMDVAEESRTNLWSVWNGYSVAEVYTSVEREYDALRGRAVLSDISPLIKYRVSGADVLDYLDRLLTRSVRKMEVGEVRRALPCTDAGTLVTDGLIFRMGDDDFRLTLASAHLDWLLDSADGFEVTVEDVSGTIAGIALAGPFAAQVLASAGFDAIGTLARNRARWFEIMSAPVYVSRTGTTGDLEYELWVDPEDVPLIWRRLMEAGKPVGLEPMGTTTRNIARLEAGVPREGVDYFSALTALTPEAVATPYDLGLGNLVDLDRNVFNGKGALQSAHANGCSKVLVGLELDTDQHATFQAIYCGDDRVGSITSTVWSPMLQVHIALAKVDRDALAAPQEGAESINVHAEFLSEGSVRRKRLPTVIRKRPFLALSRRSQTPPRPV